MQKIVVITLFLTLLINSVAVELTELEIKDELYTGYILTKKESSKYSFIGITEEGDAIIIAAQKRNPSSLHGYNFVQCVVHTNKDKFCYYIDWVAGRRNLTLFRLKEPNPKAFALFLLYASISAKRSNPRTKICPKYLLN